MCTGANGESIYIKVPLGTSIYDASNNELLADILKDNQEYIVCAGGKGGHGNAYFKSAINKAPTLYENGDLGEIKKVNLKLKYIADIGLIGLPNAGKSTLISQITNAKPKIANYQFTTLTPVLGMAQIKNYHLTFADIPGLIEGASDGKGLGHEFLKHIERCQALVHLISLDPIDNPNIVEAYDTICKELKQYNEALLDKPIIVVANKNDVIGADKQFAALDKYLKNPNLLQISALKKNNIDKFLDEVLNVYLQQLNKNVNDNQQIYATEYRQEKEVKKDVQIIQVDDHV